ncbi:MAG: amidohydrolase family protein [Phycisphaerales bacterium]
MNINPILARALTASASALLVSLAPITASAQPTGDSALSSPENGPRVTDPGLHAIVGGTVHLPSGAEAGATILIRDGKVERIMRDGGDADLSGYRVWELAEDAHVYPGFVEPWFEVDTPAHESSMPGRHWNSRITPNRSVLEGSGLSGSDAESLRKLGFVAAGIAPKGGILRGLGAVVSTSAPTNNTAADDPTVYRRRAFHTADFFKSGWGGAMEYPTSQMGCIALIRQSIDDAEWQASSGLNPSTNSLDALTMVDAPFFFHIDHELEALQADHVLGAFDSSRELVLVGTGTEFKRLDAIADTGASVIVPLRFPRKPDVSSVGKAESVDLSTMMVWEQAPTNARRLVEAGVTTAITSSKSRKRGKFFDNLHEAIEAGLSKESALAMVTTVPADLLGVGDTLGTIEAGKPACLVVASGDLFDPDTEDVKVRDVWVEGVRHEISTDDAHPFDGEWAIWVGPEDQPVYEMTINVDGKKITGTEAADGDEPSTGDARHVKMTENTISFLLDDEDDGTGTYIMSGILTGDRIAGSAIGPDDGSFTWAAKRIESEEAANEEDTETDGSEVADEADEDLAPEDLPGYPFGAYAYSEIPPQEAVFFTNATIWTSGPAGVIERGSLLIENGRISVIADQAEGDIALRLPENARSFDLEGKHITPGIVDAHSHTGTWTFGTNEGAQSVTAEVRMEDTSDPDHINWYRQLAAGVTTVNTLHGSANPIGGQNVIQKVRWGSVHPRDMHLSGAMPGIKFALGENVTHANWGNDGRDRYPQTRMGVDSIMRDRFTAARQYARDWTSYLRSSGDSATEVGMSDSLAKSLAKASMFDGQIPPNSELPRRDHELDALAEILAGDRLIHCHSYRQDEILMLAEIAREFGFTIGTYQHGLEAYKVAEAVRERSRGASIFSDWWAYKVEVQDAIAQAGPVMWEAGVNVSYNSDSDNMVRRLNTEAAKAIKYGNVPEDEAFKFVTINPAYQLGIEDRVGSIEVGKDADIAIWSGPPMSTLSQCEQTWVDGRQYFSIEKDNELRERIAAERARLVAKINGKPDKKADKEEDEADTTESDEESETPERRLSLAQRIQLDQLRAHNLNLWLEGKELDTTMQPGDCGCGLSHMGIIR